MSQKLRLANWPRGSGPTPRMALANLRRSDIPERGLRVKWLFSWFFVVSALLYRSQLLLCFVVDEKLSNAFGLNCGSFSGSIATFF